MDKQYYKPPGFSDQGPGGYGGAPSYGRGRGGPKPMKKVCNFYVDGACKKGNNCDFYHPKNVSKYKQGGPGAPGMGAGMGGPGGYQPHPAGSGFNPNMPAP